MKGKKGTRRFIRPPFGGVTSMRQEAQDLLIQAERDLLTAQHLHEAGDYYASVFFSQQSSEKALKALWMVRERETIHTHNLVRLGKGLGAGEQLMRGLRRLSPEYIMTRYPNAAGGPVEELYDEEKSGSSLTIASEVVDWTKNQLSL